MYGVKTCKKTSGSQDNCLKIWKMTSNISQFDRPVIQVLGCQIIEIKGVAAADQARWSMASTKNVHLQLT